MIIPTPRDLDALFTRLAKTKWINEGCVIEDASREHPFGMVPTELGRDQLLYLYRMLLELGQPAPTEGEWRALLGLVLRYGQRHNIPELPPPDHQERT